MPVFQIRNRWTAAVLFECELSAEVAGASYGFQLGFAVKQAIQAGADLSGAILAGAILSDAILAGAKLSAIRADLIAEILKLPNELDALRLAITEGRIDGSSYSGECACLAGTLGHARGDANYHGADIPINETLTFHASSRSPRERWFLAIERGDTPETNPAAACALRWVDEAIAIRDLIRATAPGEA